MEGYVKKEKYDALEQAYQELKHELAQLKRLFLASKTERYIPQTDVSQGNLFEEGNKSESEPIATEDIHYTRKKPAKKHNGRNTIPDHLPVEEIIIEPTEEVSGLIKIGEEITETLVYTPASLVKRRYIRYKYAKADGAGIVIGALPTRPIDKCIAEASLLAYILVCKFISHLPFYRQIQMFQREFGWQVSSSTINDWMIGCCELIKPLYNRLKQKVLESDYIQADESPIKVQDKEKSGSTHQGYQWVYHAPEEGLVLFNYRKGRGQNGPKEMLSAYQGYIQCDGYNVYDKVAKLNPGITLIGCLAHARRKFIEARNSDASRSDYALSLFQQIYWEQRQIQDQKELSHDQIQKQRLERIKPLLEQIKQWIENESIKVLPKSPIGKAMNYYQSQWPKLENILLDPKINLDNNLIENKIRPLALGRKNFLFAGSHPGAERIAVLYSLLGTCQIHEINPRVWLQDVLEKLPVHPIKAIDELLPMQWKLNYQGDM